MEIFAWHKKVGKWVEVGNSGLFRPETLRPYNVDVPVIAWGLAVERLASIIYEIEDIRKLVGPMVDVDWIRSYKIPKIGL
jgi:phenylalanyl-tRNA synthetase alpha chain